MYEYNKAVGNDRSVAQCNQNNNHNNKNNNAEKADKNSYTIILSWKKSSRFLLFSDMFAFDLIMPQQKMREKKSTTRNKTISSE